MKVPLHLLAFLAQISLVVAQITEATIADVDVKVLVSSKQQSDTSVQTLWSGVGAVAATADNGAKTFLTQRASLPRPSLLAEEDETTPTSDDVNSDEEGEGEGEGEGEASEDVDDSGDLTFWVEVIGIIYVILAMIAYKKTKAGSAKRHLVDEVLCCWKNLYLGKACFVWNLLFSPVILLIHSIRIYVPSCVLVYFWRLSWLICNCTAHYYKDPEFPPDDTSLGNVGGDSANKASGSDKSSITWVRAMDLKKKSGESCEEKAPHPKLHETEMCLFHGHIEPADILQGSLGDCWLLAAMATLSEEQERIKRLFITREVEPGGKYRVRLYDAQQKAWKTITVDDFVPCQADSKGNPAYGIDGYPVVSYCKPKGVEIWTLILEKAFAKLCGSYAKIEGGLTEWGIMCMTGGEAFRYNINPADGIWTRSKVQAMASKDDKRAAGLSRTQTTSGQSVQHSSDETFQLLRYYDRNGAVLCCGGVTKAGEAKGLVAGHAFSLLQARSIQKSLTSRDFFRFVQIRNPWGTGEWTGPWCDGSPEWEKYPHIKQELYKDTKAGDDGVYWMQWEDFCQYWGYFGVVDCDNDIFTISPPVYDETDRWGPLKGFFEGCFQYWCLCGGFKHFFLRHTAVDYEPGEEEYDRCCGFDQRGFDFNMMKRNKAHEGADDLADPLLKK